MSTFNDIATDRSDNLILADLVPGDHLVDHNGNVSLVFVNDFKDFIRWFFNASGGKWNTFTHETFFEAKKVVREALNKCYIRSHRYERSILFFHLKRLWRYLNALHFWMEQDQDRTWFELDNDLANWDFLFQKAKVDDEVDNLFIQNLLRLDKPINKPDEDSGWQEVTPKHPPPPPPSASSPVTEYKGYDPEEEEEKEKPAQSPPTDISEMTFLLGEKEGTPVTFPASGNVFVTGSDNPADPIWTQYESWPVIFDREHVEDNRDTPASRALREEIMNRMIVIEENNFEVDQRA